MPANKPDRRALLNVLLGIGGAATTGAIAYPVVSFLQPPARPEHSDISVTLEKPFSEYQPGDWEIFRFGDKPGLLICVEEGAEKKLLAYDATCTHLNCIVEFQPENMKIFCPCHNGSFDIKGNNIAGPPPRPLEQYTVQIADDVIKIVKGG